MNAKLCAFLVLITTLIVSCAPAAYGNSVNMTLTPMSDRVRTTATVRAAEESGSGDKLATAAIKATEKSKEIYATQTARASLNDADKLATATAIAPVVAELPRYGLEMDQGYVAWVHRPVEIKLEGYQQTGFVNDYPLVTAKDFVLVSDITWNTTYGSSGCGFMFRSNGDQKKPSQYAILLTRMGNGYVIFTATLNGKIGNIGTFFAKKEDSAFNWFNDATNRLAVVVRGNMIDIYTNGTWIGQIDITAPPPNDMPVPDMPKLPPGASDQQKRDYDDLVGQYRQSVNNVTAQFNEAKNNFLDAKTIFYDGMLGMVAMSESGSLSCKYSNTWLFMIEK